MFSWVQQNIPPALTCGELAASLLKWSKELLLFQEWKTSRINLKEYFWFLEHQMRTRGLEFILYHILSQNALPCTALKTLDKHGISSAMWIMQRIWPPSSYNVPQRTDYRHRPPWAMSILVTCPHGYGNWLICLLFLLFQMWDCSQKLEKACGPLGKTIVMAKVYQTASTDEHNIPKSTQDYVVIILGRRKKKKNINEVANDMKGIVGQLPFSPCGRFHLQENWSWQDRFLCNLFKTLHAFGYLVISKNYVKIKLCILIHGMHSFQSFVFDFVWFPSAAQHLCKGFYAFTSHVLNTLRQHIWCSHFFSNVCTWKPHGGIKQCVFSLRTVHILQPLGRNFLAKANPCSQTGLTTWSLAVGPHLLLTFGRHLQMWFSSWKLLHVYVGYQNVPSIFKPRSMTVFQVGWK